MTSKTLERSGLLLILSGILLVLGTIFHPSMAVPDYAARPAWMPAHILLGFSALIGLFGLAGLFGVMNLNLRTAGKAAFGLAMLGNVLLTGIMFFVEATILPVLARDPSFQPLLARGGLLMAGPLGIAIGLSMLIAAIGYLLLGWYLVDTGTIPAVNGILFIGAPLLVFTPPLPFALGIIGGLLLGTAVIWLGISIRAGFAHGSLESSLRVQDECLSHLGHA